MADEDHPVDIAHLSEVRRTGSRQPEIGDQEKKDDASCTVEAGFVEVREGSAVKQGCRNLLGQQSLLQVAPSQHIVDLPLSERGVHEVPGASRQTRCRTCITKITLTDSLSSSMNLASTSV